MQEQDLQGMRALVSGGTSGVGLAIARGLVRRGAVVVVTGRNAERGAVAAASAAVILLTKALGRELARDHIRVNALALTLTSETPSWDRIFSEASFGNRLFTKALERFPQGRAPAATEVAEAALFLASPAASQITGQTISVNGGLSFGGW